MWVMLFNNQLWAADVGETVKWGRVERLRSGFVWAPAERRRRAASVVTEQDELPRASNIWDIFYCLWVNTQPPAVSTTDRSAQKSSGSSLPCWFLHLSVCYMKDLTLTNAETRARTLSCFNKKCLTFWPNNSVTSPLTETGFEKF